MTVISITEHTATSQEDRRKRFVHFALAKINRHVLTLRMAADSAALADAEPELVEALYHVHKQLRAEYDQLLRLL